MTQDLYDNLTEYLASSEWTQKNENSVLEPYSFVTRNPGKDIRGKLISGFNIWLNVPQDKLTVIEKVINMLHCSSLMVDDIEDDSQLRRGQPVAHKVYGIPQTINSANYAYFLAYKELLGVKGAQGESLDEIVTEELLSLHRGQGLDILWRDTLRCPSEEDYVKMVNQKSGGLLRLGMKLMMACATTNRDVDYVPVINLIGVFGQIRDDYMNLHSTEYTRNKGFAEDLSEGKFSFPVIHGIHADPKNHELINIIQKRPTTPTLKVHAIKYLHEKTKSFEYTLEILKKLEKNTRAEIHRLGGNAGLERLMDFLHVDEGM